MLTIIAILIVGAIAVTAKIHRSMSPHTILGFFLYFSILSILIRSVYLDFDVAIDVINPWNSFLFDLTKIDLVYGGFLYLSFIITMCIGFSIFKPRLQLDPIYLFYSRKFIPDYGSMLRTLRIFNAVSLGTFVYFIYSNLLDQPIILSAYRGISSDLDSYNANGVVRYLISWSSVTGLIAFYLILSGKKNKILSGKMIKSFKMIIYFSLCISAGMAAFTQSRATLIFSLLNYLLIYRIFIGKWNVIKYVFPLSILLIVLFYAMTAVRAGSGIEHDDGVYDLAKFTAPIVLNNSGVDIGKTIIIINHFEKNDEFLFGSSFFQLVLSYVPRSIWKDKPVNLDTMIGIKVYGADTFGTGAVPPGLPAESFINFHYAGFFLFALLVGIFAKIIHIDYLKNRNNFFYPVVYVCCFIYVLHSFVGSGFAQTMMGVINNYLTICLIIFISKFNKIILDPFRLRKE